MFEEYFYLKVQKLKQKIYYSINGGVAPVRDEHKNIPLENCKVIRRLNKIDITSAGIAIVWKVMTIINLRTNSGTLWNYENLLKGFLK